MSEGIPQSVEVAEGQAALARFRNRPFEVTAIQWVGESNCREAFAFVGLDHADWADDTGHFELHIPNRLDTVTARHGDWLVKDADGEITVMRPAEFDARFEETPRPEPFEPGTNYHDSVDHLRRDIVAGSIVWDQIAKKHAGDLHTASPAQCNALGAALMAGSYGYTLAALLGYARKYGDHIANDLAFLADEILTNGDFDDLNADVMPEPGQVEPEPAEGPVRIDTLREVVKSRNVVVTYDEWDGGEPVELVRLLDVDDDSIGVTYEVANGSQCFFVVPTDTLVTLVGGEG